MTEVIIVAAALTPAGWTLIGFLLCIAGVNLIAYTGNIPIVNVITSMIGWSLIMIGGYFGVYGVFGESAVKLYGIAFILIWIVGVIVILLYEAGILKRREEAYGGE